MTLKLKPLLVHELTDNDIVTIKAGIEQPDRLRLVYRTWHWVGCLWFDKIVWKMGSSFRHRAAIQILRLTLLWKLKF